MNSPSVAQEHPRSRWISSLWLQVLVAIALGIAVGRFAPAQAVALKPLGDGFIRLITMVITLIIFCTVVTGIAGMQDIRKVGRVGGKALLYFEIVSTLALLIGLAVADVVQPGKGFNVNPATLDAKALAGYTVQARAQSVSDFVFNIIPDTVIGSFARGSILQVVLIAVLFGFAIAAMGRRAEILLTPIRALTQAIFGVVNIIMFLAPVGAFGAIAFTVGRYGLHSLDPLGKLILTFCCSCILFVFLILGAVARISGFSITRFLLYFRDELILVLGTASSETALPGLMRKLEEIGCSKAVVGLVVPTGYTFNTDGSSLYITMAALFVAQATNTHLTLTQQLTVFAVAVLTSKGASGVQGAGFIALAGTLMVVPSIPVAGMALLLGIDRFLSTFRALINMIGNGVATIVIALSEHELDAASLRAAIARSPLPAFASIDDTAAEPILTLNEATEKEMP
ncbi:MAG: C4-dicarboxylate transporter DctA [Terracidiphilus sp.]